MYKNTTIDNIFTSVAWSGSKYSCEWISWEIVSLFQREIDVCDIKWEVPGPGRENQLFSSSYHCCDTTPKQFKGGGVYLGSQFPGMVWHGRKVMAAGGWAGLHRILRQEAVSDSVTRFPFSSSLNLRPHPVEPAAHIEDRSLNLN